MKAARITGIPKSERTVAKALPIPDSRKIPPNIPPAPVTKTTEQIGAKAFSHKVSIFLAPKLLLKVITQRITVIKRAIGV